MARERTAIAWVENVGGEVAYLHSSAKSWWKESTDKWFGERVYGVYFSRTEVNDLSPLTELTHLKDLELDYTEVNDLSPLAELTHLEGLCLSDTRVSPAKFTGARTHTSNKPLPSSSRSKKTPLARQDL